MSKNDPTVRIIENARARDVRPDGHIILNAVRTRDDTTTTIRREGIAHHRDEDGDWRTEGGAWHLGHRRDHDDSPRENA